MADYTMEDWQAAFGAPVPSSEIYMGSIDDLAPPNTETLVLQEPGQTAFALAGPYNEVIPLTSGTRIGGWSEDIFKSLFHLPILGSGGSVKSGGSTTPSASGGSSDSSFGATVGKGLGTAAVILAVALGGLVLWKGAAVPALSQRRIRKSIQAQRRLQMETA